jgi:hypothetical protein
MRLGRILAAISLCAATALAQEAPKFEVKAGPLAPFRWFADLAGSCWAGSHAKTTQTLCYLPQYERLIRGSIKVTESDKVTFEGDAVFAVDPGDKDQKRIVYAQWGSGGLYSTGDIVFEGETLFFNTRLPDGTVAPARHVWRRADADTFKVTREHKTDSRWVEQFTVEYKRIPGR